MPAHAKNINMALSEEDRETLRRLHELTGIPQTTNVIRLALRELLAARDPAPAPTAHASTGA